MILTIVQIINDIVTCFTNATIDNLYLLCGDKSTIKPSWNLRYSIFRNIGKNVMTMKTLAALRIFVDLDLTFLSPLFGYILGATTYNSNINDPTQSLFNGITYRWFCPSSKSRFNKCPTLQSLKESNQKLIIYYHGGGFCLGSFKSYLLFLMELTTSTDICVVAVDYRRAPEFPYPIPGQDCLEVYKKVLEYLPGSSVILAGDSAGGALVVEVMTKIRDEGDQKNIPLGGLLLSPWVDIYSVSGTMITNGKYDILPKKPLFATSYLRNINQLINLTEDNNNNDDNVNKSKVLVSAIDQDLKGFPPLLIEVGDSEMFYDQILEFFEKVKKSNVSVICNIYEDMVHVFQVFFSSTGHPSVSLSFRNIRKFVDKLILSPGDISSSTAFIKADYNSKKN